MANSSITIQNILGQDGLLAQSLHGFESRSSQIQMALLIQNSLQKRIPAIVEAGTGTGKTFGYLAPLRNKKSSRTNLLKRHTTSTKSNSPQYRCHDHEGKKKLSLPIQISPVFCPIIAFKQSPGRDKTKVGGMD
jgi:hypothetical protein